MMLGSYPQTFKEAFHDPRWQESMDEEYDSLHENKTWELVSLPPRRKLVQCKWIYNTKIDVDGTKTKYKAQLVAKGYSQFQGLDYNETFAPVARMDSIRLVLAVAASKRWEVHHMDVKSAFLHGDLKEYIYMKQPEGYIEDPSLVCKLRKSLYGLKQDPRSWYSKMDAFLMSQKFGRCKSNCNVYMQKKDGSLLLIVLYVDDLLITSSSVSILRSIKSSLNK